MKSYKKDVVAWNNMFEGKVCLTNVLIDAVEKYGFDGVIATLGTISRGYNQRKMSNILKELSSQIKN